MIDVNTIILTESDLIDPTKNKKADITLDAFHSYVTPMVNAAAIALYISPKGGLIVLQDKRNILEAYFAG